MKSSRSAILRLRRRRALTLPELMVVIAIIAVLALVFAGSYQRYIAKAEGIDVMGKLSTMHKSLLTYMLEKGSWPQEPEEDSDGTDEALWDWWKKEMKPYGLSDADWFTSSHLRRLNEEMKANGGKPISMEEMREAVSFPSIIPTPFAAGPTEPYRYEGQPWISETGEYHGDDGMFVIRADGSIHRVLTMSQMNALRGKSRSPAKK